MIVNAFIEFGFLLGVATMCICYMNVELIFLILKNLRK